MIQTNQVQDRPQSQELLIREKPMAMGINQEMGADVHYRSTVKEPSKIEKKKRKNREDEEQEESFKASEWSSVRSFDLRQPPASISNIHKSDELLMERAHTEAGS